MGKTLVGRAVCQASQVESRKWGVILGGPMVEGWMKPTCFHLLGQMLGLEFYKAPAPLKAWRQRTGVEAESGLEDPQGCVCVRARLRVLGGHGDLYLGLATDSPKALSPLWV